MSVFEDRMLAAYNAGKASALAGERADSRPFTTGTPADEAWVDGFADYQPSGRPARRASKISVTFDPQVYDRIEREANAAGISFARRLREILACL